MGWRETPSPGQIAAIAGQIDTYGYCRIDGFIGSDELGSLVDFAQAAVLRSGGEYASFGGVQAFAGTVWEEMASSPALQLLCESLCQHASGKTLLGTGFHQVFRCLQGQSSRQHSFYFHFDSYVVTVVVPIVIPAAGKSGDLIIFPTLRPIRKAYWRNVLDKLIAELKPMQLYYRLLTRLPRSPATSIPLTPGSAILFWGYRTLHTNQPCDPDKLRATGLLHFGDLHRDEKAARRSKQAGLQRRH